jgi:hypothetical protein
MKYQIGHVLLQRAKRRDHTYVLTRTDKHMKRRGRVVDILVWVGSCATCGCSFEATSPTAGGQYLNRTTGTALLIGAECLGSRIKHRQT